MSGRSARQTRQVATKGRAPTRPGQATLRSRRTLTAGVAVAVVLVGLYFVNRHASGRSESPNAYPYAVGSPGPDHMALALRLPATTGRAFDLASYRGKAPVLLYFQEGLTCQPCWDQAAAIQKDAAKFHALGIGPIVSITTDPLNLLKQ